MSEHHDHRDDCPFKFATLDVCDCVEKNMLDRIEALTEQLEAARADAKEAEAYAEELEKERDDYAFKLADANNTYSEMHVALSGANDKLAKAVEALRGLMQHMPDYADTVWQDACETLAEIEGEKT
jgi:uncharacterized coiled-coil DUF342 family protein